MSLLLSRIMRWMKLEPIIQSEVSQKEKHQYSILMYSYLFKNFPQFLVIHTIKSFGLVNKAEIDVFWNSLTFLMI